MSSIDRLSNMLSGLKNASMAGRSFIEIPYTKTCEAVAKVLKDKGFLSEVKNFKKEASNVKMLHLELSKNNGITSLTDAKRISKPGRRIYRGSDDLRTVSNGFGCGVISTSKGIMDYMEAKKKKLGGEVLCEVL